MSNNSDKYARLVVRLSVVVTWLISYIALSYVMVSCLTFVLLLVIRGYV